jgi:hypothetical protein
MEYLLVAVVAFGAVVAGALIGARIRHRSKK